MMDTTPRRLATCQDCRRAFLVDADNDRPECPGHPDHAVVTERIHRSMLRIAAPAITLPAP